VPLVRLKVVIVKVSGYRLAEVIRVPAYAGGLEQVQAQRLDLSQHPPRQTGHIPGGRDDVRGRARGNRGRGAMDNRVPAARPCACGRSSPRATACARPEPGQPITALRCREASRRREEIWQRPRNQTAAA
jgi:hypothetical protein